MPKAWGSEGSSSPFPVCPSRQRVTLWWCFAHRPKLKRGHSVQKHKLAEMIKTTRKKTQSLTCRVPRCHQRPSQCLNTISFCYENLNLHPLNHLFPLS